MTTQALRDDVSQLKSLGSKTTDYAYDQPGAEMLETFPSKHKVEADAHFSIQLTFPEFTSLCPKTGQPDFGTIEITYTPDKLCVESKSLKLYLFAFRNAGAFMESITDRICNDLVALLDPIHMKVRGLFNPRGGVAIEVKAEHWKPIPIEVKHPESTGPK